MCACRRACRRYRKSLFSSLPCEYTRRMRLYPVFLALTGSRVLVAGAGSVGRRKIAGLCEANACDILVLDPGLSSNATREIENLPGVSFHARSATKEDLPGCALVFAATGDAAENRRIADWCRSLNIPCNIADDPVGSSFHVPAHTNVHGLAVAFSTGGQSPALAARIRREAGEWLENRYGPLLVFMGRVRPLVLGAGFRAEQNGGIFRSLANSGLGDALRRKDGKTARDLASMMLPASLHDHIEELFHGLC